MGIIDLYGVISRPVKATLNVTPINEEKQPEVNIFRFVDDSVVVTLAEFDEVSKDAITAHRLKDYRRKTFNLTLLPDVRIMLDDILEGSTYWNAKLHNESPYS